MSDVYNRTYHPKFLTEIKYVTNRTDLLYMQYRDEDPCIKILKDDSYPKWYKAYMSLDYYFDFVSYNPEYLDEGLEKNMYDVANIIHHVIFGDVERKEDEVVSIDILFKEIFKGDKESNADVTIKTLISMLRSYHFSVLNDLRRTICKEAVNMLTCYYNYYTDDIKYNYIGNYDYMDKYCEMDEREF